VVDVAWYRTLNDEHLERVRQLLLAVCEVDGRPEVPDHGLPAEFRGGMHALATAGNELVGYAHLNTAGDAFGHQVGELFVRPDHRCRGLGHRLIVELTRHAGATEGSGDRLRLWAHGNLPAAAVLAARHGFVPVRELRRMRLEMATEPPAPRVPGGVRLRAFRPGSDEPPVARVNARAFSWHPEQAALTAEDIAATEAEEWFDPDGFLLAERDGTLVGFHWTKVHKRAAGDTSGQPMGEIYVIGVDPEAHGGGLGKALTLAGLRYLHQSGLRQAMLYVESDNTAAVAMYERLGFIPWDSDVQYGRRPGS